jgi:electron transfer flavoprotein alpha/beta subunit
MEMMNIVVCIKQVPDTTDVKIDPKTGTLIRDGVPSIINPDDRHAIEEGLKLKELHGGRVVVLSMGPPQAMDALMEAKAMGVDECYLISDRAFAGADTLATSYSLAKAVQTTGDWDIILCGRQAIDGDTAQIGPQMAEALGVPQVTYCIEIVVDGGKVTAKRALEDGYEVISTQLPALFTVIKDINKPRYPTVKGIVSVCRECDIQTWTAKSIGASPKMIGLNGSPTQVARTFAPEPKGAGVMLKGEPEDVVAELVKRLREKNVVRVR